MSEQTVMAEHNGDGLWRFVVYRRGARAYVSGWSYTDDLFAKEAGRRFARSKA